MRIDQIVLHNFGSYEGETVFDTCPQGEQNIVLIGGKNGAGKTTLFTAMRLCLYGYMSMGYKNANAYYFRAVNKLINNTAKLTRPAETAVHMTLSLSNGQTLDEYVLCRSWVLEDNITETFTATRNGAMLSAQEVADFEKYLLLLIPPELFNLYFFDGEKIADFFLDEGGNARLKNAFLTLCGYDTFEIMRKNFKRVGGANKTANPALDDYLQAKEQAALAEEECLQAQNRLTLCVQAMNECDAALDALEKDYRQKGGVSQEEWNEKLLLLRDEEKKREQWNLFLKKCANEIVPFLMLRERLTALKAQIERENDSTKYRHFCEVLRSPSVAALAKTCAAELEEAAFAAFGGESQPILQLSFAQSAQVLMQIERVLAFEEAKIAKCKQTIQKSLALTAKTRAQLENSSVAAVQEYMARREELLEQKSAQLSNRVELEQLVLTCTERAQQATAMLAKAQAGLEDEIKRSSISDISARAILMLDRLQTELYRRQIDKVETFFRKEIRTLMRKTKLIDDIRIDEQFNARIYRTEAVACDRLAQALEDGSVEQATTLFGEAAMEALVRLAKTSSASGLAAFCRLHSGETVELPFEIDKSSLSNGEKQIYIMALYHALVGLCKHELPFIIDTPFARIDTEHRRNISKHFFRKLKGQVFILSTNEEIDSAHVQILRDRIAATYILENTDNARTIVTKNTYFEV